MMRELQKFQVAIKAFVLDGDRALMLREADTGLWELPGGRIEIGEEWLPPTDVLRRELSEELGAAFACEIGEPAAVWVRPPDPPRRNNAVFLVGYRCRFRGGAVLLSGEHVEFRWVTRAESENLPLAPGYAGALAACWSPPRCAP